MEAESEISDSSREKFKSESRLGLVVVVVGDEDSPLYRVSKRHSARSFAKSPNRRASTPLSLSLGRFYFFPPRPSSLIRREAKRHRDRPVSQKGPYFTISRLVIVQRHRKHTHACAAGLRVTSPGIRERRRAISIYGRSEHPRDVEFITAYSP